MEVCDSGGERKPYWSLLLDDGEAIQTEDSEPGDRRVGMEDAVGGPAGAGIPPAAAEAAAAAAAAWAASLSLRRGLPRFLC